MRRNEDRYSVHIEGLYTHRGSVGRARNQSVAKGPRDVGELHDVTRKLIV